MSASIVAAGGDGDDQPHPRVARLAPAADADASAIDAGGRITLGRYREGLRLRTGTGAPPLPSCCPEDGPVASIEARHADHRARCLACYIHECVGRGGPIELSPWPRAERPRPASCTPCVLDELDELGRLDERRLAASTLGRGDDWPLLDHELAAAEGSPLVAQIQLGVHRRIVDRVEIDRSGHEVLRAEELALTTGMAGLKLGF